MALREAWSAVSMKGARRMGWIMRMGAWLLVLPSIANRMELGTQELRYSLFLRYGITPPDLQDHCRGCGAAFDI